MTRTSGSSMFELVVAIGIIGLILLTLVSLATLSVKNASFSRNQSEAARLGQQALEWLRSERDKNLNTFVTSTTTNQKICMTNPLSWSSFPVGPCGTANTISGIFKREADFTATDEDGDTFIDKVEAVITVNWADSQGDHTVRNSTYFTDWRLK